MPHQYLYESFSREVADVAVLTLLLLVSGAFSLLKKPQCAFVLLMSIGLGYFGFFRGGCICPVGSVTNVTMGLAKPEMVGKIVVALFMLPLIASWFFGRVFCSSACPLGALQHLFSKKAGYQVPTRIDRILRHLPILVLFATVWGALRGGIFLACRLDPYKTAFFAGHAWIGELANWMNGTLTEHRLLFVGDVMAWTTLGFALLLGLFVPRPFCRYLCPYGVLLGIFAKLGPRRRRIDPESCFTCIVCTKTCPVQAISAETGHLTREVKVSDFYCVQCGRCDSSCSVNAFRIK